MDEALAATLVRLANSHDDGTEQPRAEYDAVKGVVVLRSTELHLDSRAMRVVSEEARNLEELRTLLGY